MILLSPLFAWLLPLALLPVVFHLFFRIRKQPRPFPSLLFFLAADPRLSARRRLREWLVLLLRTLALAACLLALARPMRAGWGGGETQAVVVIDNSASMGATDADGRTRLSRALAAAGAVLQDHSVRQAAVLTTVRDPAIALPGGFSDDLPAMRAALAAVRLTQGGSDAAGVLRQAAALTRGVLRGRPEVHLCTDVQASDWAVASTPVTFARGTVVIVHDVSRNGDHAGTLALLPPAPARRLVAGRPWRLDVTVRNAGAQEAEGVVNAVLGETRLRQPITVAAGQTHAVRLVMPGLAAGEQMARIWLDGPAAGPASEAWQVAAVAPPDDVWFLGDARNYGLLGLALAPAEQGLLTGLRVTAVPAARLTAAAAGPRPVLVAASFRELADGAVAAACRAYVVRGGTLLVCPEPDATTPPSAGLPDWCGIGTEARRQVEQGEPLTVFQADAALWDDLRDAQGAVNLRGVQLHCWFPLTVNAREGTVALAGTPDGRAALTRTALGRGVVYALGFAWDVRWSNLPRRAACLPLALGLARPATPDEPAATAALAGAAVPAAQRVAGSTLLQLRTVAGDVLSWQGRAETLSASARAGIYRVEGLPQPLLLAVAGNPAEAVPGQADAHRLPLLAGTECRVLAYAGAAETAEAVQQARQGRSLMGLFLGLAALLWLAELLLLNQRRLDKPVAEKAR